MKTEKEMDELLSMSYKGLESELGIKIRNGQAVEAIRKTIAWAKKTSEAWS